jgi:uncharacterized repeat protein (TIGR03803 family)
VYSFRKLPDGAVPDAGLTYFKGTLYGTTIGGGVSCRTFSLGCGTVFSVTPSGTETVLHSFKGGKDGGDPEARMIVRNGTLYGTTENGGGKCPPSSLGCGTVFSITPSGHETVLHDFADSPDGSQPHAALLNVNGVLYGTTSGGGANGKGTVFSITPGGKEKVLYSFGNGTDGADPPAGLIDVKGTLYGTTSGAYASSYGTVFSITPGGKEKVLHNFGRTRSDGADPAAGLVDVSGTLYGTTDGGGAYGHGTVFSITLRGKEKVLHSFSCCRRDGLHPGATLLNVNGTLYGTTYAGGTSNYGTVFSITLSGQETVLHSFVGGPQDGKYPVSSGVIDVNGTLYGTTTLGGAHGSGTVYSITP